MIINLSKNSDGVWVYVDQEQASLAITVLVLTGMEICGFDDWINTDSAWVNMPATRAELIQLRESLLETYRCCHGDNYRIEMEARLLFARAKGIATLVEGRKYLEKVKTGNLGRAKAAKFSRRKNPLREKVKEILASERRQHRTLLEALANWSMGAVNGLSIAYNRQADDGSYIVDDQNATKKDCKKDRKKIFTVRQLKAIWTEVS